MQPPQDARPRSGRCRRVPFGEWLARAAAAQQPTAATCLLLSAAIAGSSDDGRRGGREKSPGTAASGVGMRLDERARRCELGCEPGRGLGARSRATRRRRAPAGCSWGGELRVKRKRATAGGSAASSDEAVARARPAGGGEERRRLPRLMQAACLCDGGCGGCGG